METAPLDTLLRVVLDQMQLRGGFLSVDRLRKSVGVQLPNTIYQEMLDRLEKVGLVKRKGRLYMLSEKARRMELRGIHCLTIP